MIALRRILASLFLTLTFVGPASADDEPNGHEASEAPAQASASTKPRDPLERAGPAKLYRSLAVARDAIVREGAPVALTSAIAGDLDAAIAKLPAERWQEPAQRDALVAYALSGARPALVLAVVARARDALGPEIADALAHHARRDEKAAEALQAAMPLVGDPVRPIIELALGTLRETKPDAARAHYRRAELGAPGTLVEEAALRRRLALLLVDTDGAEAWPHAAETYLRRYARSPYAGATLRGVVSALAQADDPKLAERLILALPSRARAIFALELSREAAVAGRAALAERALAHAEDGPRRALYRSLVEVEDPPAPDAALDATDRALMRALTGLESEITRRTAAAEPAKAESAASVPNDPIAADVEAALDAARALLERSR